MNHKLVEVLRYESTLNSPVIFRGVGLHTWESSVIRIERNTSEDGIVFIRNNIRTKLLPENIDTNSRTTSLCDSKGRVVAMTIEHMLSAFYALEIRNAEIHLVTGNEIPILNGGSNIFYDRLSRVSTRVRKATLWILVNEETVFSDSTNPERLIKISPAGHGTLRIISRVGYTNSPVLSEEYQLTLDNPLAYRRGISRARTSYPFYLSDKSEMNTLFERLKWIQINKFRKNVNVIDPAYSNWRRYSNEIARHKILDFLGDLQVANMPFINGVDILLNQSWHSLHMDLVRRFTWK